MVTRKVQPVRAVIPVVPHIPIGEQIEVIVRYRDQEWRVADGTVEALARE